MFFNQGTLCAVDIARGNGVTVCFAPYYVHKMLPIDVLCTVDRWTLACGIIQGGWPVKCRSPRFSGQHILKKPCIKQNVSNFRNQDFYLIDTEVLGVADFLACIRAEPLSDQLQDLPLH